MRPEGEWHREQEAGNENGVRKQLNPSGIKKGETKGWTAGPGKGLREGKKGESG
jgi:hypothetical protein